MVIVKKKSTVLQEQSDLGLHCLHMPFCQKRVQNFSTFTITLFFCSSDLGFLLQFLSSVSKQ